MLTRYKCDETAIDKEAESSDASKALRVALYMMPYDITIPTILIKGHSQDLPEKIVCILRKLDFE